MLRQLGCCYSSHNVWDAAATVKHDLFPWPQGAASKLCENDPERCERALVEEMAHFQCVADNPWASHWKALTAAYPDAFVVAPRSMSALHNAMTRTFREQRIRE